MTSRPNAPAAAPLGAWSRIGRYLVVVGGGLLLWIFVSADYLGFTRGTPVPEDDAVIGGYIVLDLVLGVLAVCVLPLRRRYPLLTAMLTAGFSAFSAFAVASAALATVSLSARRRWRPVILVGLVWVVATLFYELVLRESIPGTVSDFAFTWASGGLAGAVFVICAVTGFYIGARRELLASLRDRAENAEREQALREDAARESERTRIAREMHDVLAHHISLVSLHAGVLTYRTDLTRDESAEAAAVIQQNAQLALTELRQILGVLRTTQLSGEFVDPPQPTLAELPALLADAREAGMAVSLALTHLALPAQGLSDSVSRSGYRIVQESLTNARKHALGAEVAVALSRVDDTLQISVTSGRPESAGPAGSGFGLTGLQERAAIAGGDLVHGVQPDGSFTVAASLPWS